MKWRFILFTFLSVITLNVYAAETIVTMVSIADNKSIGKITLKDTPYGLEIIPDLKGLSSGLHGFHLHENPSCAQNGDAAGAHFDPKHTMHHQGPYQHVSHLGDLPALYFNDKQEANLPVLAPRLSVKELKRHALIIHAGGDNYSDQPKLGGGGARVACGVVE